MFLDHKEYHKLTLAITTPRFRQWSEIVEDYLRVIRNRMDNVYAIYKLQDNLISDTVNWQGYQKLSEEQIGSIDKEISSLAKEGSVEKIKARSGERQDWERSIKFAQIIRKNIRNIGDCIAWKLLDYNRAWIGVLGDKDPVGKLEMDTQLSGLKLQNKLRQVKWRVLPVGIFPIRDQQSMERQASKDIFTQQSLNV